MGSGLSDLHFQKITLAPSWSPLRTAVGVPQEAEQLLSGWGSESGDGLGESHWVGNALDLGQDKGCSNPGHRDGAPGGGSRRSVTAVLSPQDRSLP